MKRTVRFLSLVLLVVLLLPVCVYATVNIEKNENTIYFENGDYLVVKIHELSSRALLPKTANKTATYYNSDGALEWEAVLTGVFAFDGTYSTCSQSYWNITIIDDRWFEVIKSASKNGNVAIGQLVMGRSFLGVKIDEETINITITCDERGNIS